MSKAERRAMAKLANAVALLAQTLAAMNPKSESIKTTATSSFSEARAAARLLVPPDGY